MLLFLVQGSRIGHSCLETGRFSGLALNCLRRVTASLHVRLVQTGRKLPSRLLIQLLMEVVRCMLRCLSIVLGSKVRGGRALVVMGIGKGFRAFRSTVFRGSAIAVIELAVVHLLLGCQSALVSLSIVY